MKRPVKGRPPLVKVRSGIGIVATDPNGHPLALPITEGPGGTGGTGSFPASIPGVEYVNQLVDQGGTGIATSVLGRAANSTGPRGDIQATANQQILVRRNNVLGFTLGQAVGYWSSLTNGDPVLPEVIFDSFGDTIAVWTALP